MVSLGTLFVDRHGGLKLVWWPGTMPLRPKMKQPQLYFSISQVAEVAQTAIGARGVEQDLESAVRLDAPIGAHRH